MADKTPGFVHLHNHTSYSLLDGAQRIDEMCARAVNDGQPAVAVTDHGNLFAAVKFHDLAVSRGIKPIIGCEAYVAPGSRRDRVTPAEGTQGAQRKPYYHLILLAENEAGYANLMKLTSLAYSEGFVTEGAFASYSADYYEQGHLAAQMAKSIEDGAYPRDIPVQHPTGGLMINLDVAAKLSSKFKVPPSVLFSGNVRKYKESWGLTVETPSMR